jgi:xylulokinase
MTAPYFLGIDVSTTGSKALLIDGIGNVIASESSPHTLQQPKPLWSEQDPREWWEAAANSVRKVLQQSGIKNDEIASIGLTGQMHGLVLLDQDGNVLRPAILWNDQRTQAECDEIHSRIGREKFIQTSGNAALTGFTAPKILWVQHHEPEIYRQVRHILLPKDYVRFRLTGEYAMDKADGSGTALFEINQRDWSKEILSILGIEPGWLPPTYEGPQFTGRVTAEAALFTGLQARTPVAAGGGDQAAQAVGVGSVEPGIAALTVGTSGVIFAPTASAQIESQGRLHTFCHAVPGMWHLMGVMLSAAGSLQWHRDTLAPGLSFDDLLQEAELVPAGSEGLQFLPYLSGERTPYPDPLARGAWIGLTLRHGRGHLTRALLEGVAFGLKDGFTLLKEAAPGEIKQVRASGGGTKGRLWREILASVLETELVTVNTSEGAAFGAALLAGVGAQCWPDVPTACKEVIAITGSDLPKPALVESYRRAYPIFHSLYPLLKPTFDKMNQ